jgi:hypothetical protein
MARAMNPPNPLRTLIRPARLVAPNRWDLIAFPIIFAVLVMLAVGAKGTFAPPGARRLARSLTGSLGSAL